MTQNELAFWRDAVIAALHAPGDALERARLALQEYREYKAAADTYHKAGGKVAVPQPRIGKCSECDYEGDFDKHVHPNSQWCPNKSKIATFIPLVAGFKRALPRLPDGSINNCALANGDDEVNCQMCQNSCPDHAKFAEQKHPLASNPGDNL